MINRLLELNRGLYAWSVPDQMSILKLQMFPFSFTSDLTDWDNPTEYHCTLLHCKDVSDADYVEEITLGMPAIGVACKPEIWEDHKQRHIVVMVLDCRSYRSLNREFQDHGLHHSHPSYTPHVTLGKFTRRLSEKEQGRLLSMLTESWTETLNFEPTVKYSLCC